MALKDIIAKLSPDNEKLFHHDPDAERRPVLERIAKNREAFADPSTKVRGGKWFEIGNNSVVAFTPTRADGQPIVIDGKSVTFWSSTEFPAILDAFEAAVRAGEIDDQLAGSTPAGASLPTRELKNPRQRAKRSDAGVSRGWSDERRARFAETIAARKVAKDTPDAGG
ncbi:hypothetical protein [Sphingomonas rubra]|uniref:Uncharacterized protein n=1 Tax=Sphingomonas rubra TaxID=634430 RepID=A0A1I5UN98_9SPHN|nr:hypothetical protein [Sphingomonas rubra]SFP96702.1 hypothetical protein SAMN04488241_11320 [Sphingomonas rubra]